MGLRIGAPARHPRMAVSPSADLLGRPSVRAHRKPPWSSPGSETIAPGSKRPFRGLSGFTELAAVGRSRRRRRGSELAEMATEVAAQHGGQVVKMLGDGVCSTFRIDRRRPCRPGDRRRAARAPAPAHVGVEAGPMLYEEGDYFGRTVKLAAGSRQAGPGRVFVGRCADTTRWRSTWQRSVVSPQRDSGSRDDLRGVVGRVNLLTGSGPSSKVRRVIDYRR